MDNLGRALTMAGFALLFIFAASAAIYLYGTVTNYLGQGTKSASIDYRAEGETTDSLYTNYKREIDVSEVYLTLYNMEQMNVDELSIRVPSTGREAKITKEESEDSNKISTFLSTLSGVNQFTYSFVRDVNGRLSVTYTGTK